MAKKKKSNKFEDDLVSNQICSKYGDIVESGTEVLHNLESYKTIGIAPALDLALGGGLREGSVIIMTGDPKTGKEQNVSAIVYTPNGPVKMGDLKIGDQVCTPDGTSSTVTGLFPQGIKDIYRITFRDGVTAECGIDHLWKVRKNDNRYPDNWKVLSLREILQEGLKYSDRYKWKIPLTQPVSFKETDQPIPPYILGCLIGDGCLTRVTPSISTADVEIFNTFRAYVEPLGLKLNHSGKYDYAISAGNIGGVINPVTESLRELGLMSKNSHTKFIPNKYKYSSIDQRWQLIKGLMDTDGYNEKGKIAEYTTVSKRLSLDVQEVLQSLGFTAKIKQRTTKYNGKEFPSYRLHISGDDISALFSLSRKIYKNKRTKPSLERTIIKIEKVRQEECRCISIDHKDHLYLTDNFVVTHNTVTSLHFAGKAQQQGKNVVYFNTEGRLTKENFTGIKTLDPDKIKIVQATQSQPVVSAETFLNTIEYYVKNQENFVGIIDSASNMVPQDELDGDVRTGVRNALPRLLSMFFKRISNDVARNRAILIFITHNIANTGGSRWSPAKMADCGNMIQYQAGTNMVITHRGKWEQTDERGQEIGQVANWVVKTSAAGGKPNSVAQSWIRYGIGIDETQEISHLSIDLTFIKQAGAWYTISAAIEDRDNPVIQKLLKDNEVDASKDENVEKFFKFQGMEKLTKFLYENEEVKDFLYEKIKEVL